MPIDGPDIGEKLCIY